MGFLDKAKEQASALAAKAQEGVNQGQAKLSESQANKKSAGLLEQRPWVPEVDAAVDGVHALTMVGLSVVSARHRRVALVSAAAAVVFAALDLSEAER